MRDHRQAILRPVPRNVRSAPDASSDDVDCPHVSSPPCPALPRKLLLLAAGQQGLLTIAQCDAHGVDRGRRARLVAAGTLRRVARGIVDTCGTGIAGRIAAREYDHVRLWKVWLAQLLAGPGSVALGQAALVVAGLHGVPWQFVPEMAYLNGRYGRSAEHVVIRQVDLGDRHFERNGLRYTEPERALAQAVPTLDRRTAIAVIDSARYRGVVDAAGLVRARELARGHRGSVRAAPWWDEVGQAVRAVVVGS
ncbi:type IV toxin-antitoxin system AbiEi family antitoxin domain-containing protein [Promicromonospora sp. NPDC023987]|uniref:type IV toxin-antitoxin system AbiEi family antitoxin domain-containing protein n=1 Tax=Promicromonospora sp. NPDC023987 TaxID=3155360 RepID=UPI0034117D84